VLIPQRQTRRLRHQQRSTAQRSARQFFPTPLLTIPSIQHHVTDVQGLHAYNEIKDMAQALLGRLAEMRGVTVSALYAELDIDFDDD
jgi:hypothetical protein